MLKKLKRPSPAMLVACLALFMALGGTGFAAVNFARNASHVDGKNAFTSFRSNDYVAGGLVSTYPGGRLKGKLAHRFLGDTPKSKPFRQQFDVTDGNASATQNTLIVTRIGTLSTTCDDENATPGVENAVSQVTFGTESGEPLDVVGRVGTGPLVAGTDGKATLTVSGTETFEFIAGTDEEHQLLIEGVVRQDGDGTADAKCTAYGTGVEIEP